MFLKEVYRHSKIMFAGFLFFIGIQLAINFKRGMVFTPFFHYGMYSWVQKPQIEYRVNVVIINGDTLAGGQYSPQAWDKIHYTLDELYLTACQKDFFHHQTERLYKKAGLGPPNPKNFVVGDSIPRLLDTYERWLPAQLNLPASEVALYRLSYRYHFNKLVYRSEDSSKQIDYPLCR